MLGHLAEICKSSKVSAEIYFSELDFLPSVEKLAKSGIIPGGTKRNFEYLKHDIEFDFKFNSIQKYLTCDAQTSGGLLVSLSPEDAKTFVESIYPEAKIIGHISDKNSKLIKVT